VWRTCYQRGHGRVTRQTTKLMNLITNRHNSQRIYISALVTAFASYLPPFMTNCVRSRYEQLRPTTRGVNIQNSEKEHQIFEFTVSFSPCCLLPRPRNSRHQFTTVHLIKAAVVKPKVCWTRRPGTDTTTMQFTNTHLDIILASVCSSLQKPHWEKFN